MNILVILYYFLPWLLLISLIVYYCINYKLDRFVKSKTIDSDLRAVMAGLCSGAYITAIPALCAWLTESNSDLDINVQYALFSVNIFAVGLTLSHLCFRHKKENQSNPSEVLLNNDAKILDMLIVLTKKVEQMDTFQSSLQEETREIHNNLVDIQKEISRVFSMQTEIIEPQLQMLHEEQHHLRKMITQDHWAKLFTDKAPAPKSPNTDQ